METINALSCKLALTRERRPGIIAIDSFKALAAFAEDAQAFRRFLHDLAALLTAFPVTSFWIGEYSEEEMRSAPEAAVADGIISLETQRAIERAQRLIQVIKLRGSNFRSGRHGYRLSEDGVTVFPRLADPISLDEYGISEARMSTGIPPLDSMLAEGLRVPKQRRPTKPGRAARERRLEEKRRRSERKQSRRPPRPEDQ